MPAEAALDLLRDNYDDLSLAEKKAADLILQDPAGVIDCTVAELARKSDVSEATVVRMCHHAGFKGYYQFRVLLARSIGTDQREESFKEGSLSEVFHAYGCSIRELAFPQNAQNMKICADMIRNLTGQLHLAVVGNTMPLALYMGFRLGRLGVRATYGVSPEYFLNNINLARPDDIVIAISQSGASLQVIQAIELAKEKGIRVIAVTASASSRVAQLADYVLLSRKEEEKNYQRNYSHLREMAVIDALLDMITNREKIRQLDADKPEELLSEYKE